MDELAKDVVISVIIDPESVERLDRLCDRLDTFRSDVVEIALEIFEEVLDARDAYRKAKQETNAEEE